MLSLVTALADGSSRVVAAETDLHVVLHYSVDASARGCWDEAAFRRSVVARVGYEPFREVASLIVGVRVGGAANAVDGHVEWRKVDGTLMGERRFVPQDGDCAKLLTEMSFAVSLQIDLLRPKAPATTGAVASPSGGSNDPGSAAGPTAPATTSAVPSSPADTSAAETGSAASTARRASEPGQPEPASSPPTPRWRIWVGLGPSVAWRLAPGITADGRLLLGIRRADLSLEIGGEGTYPSTKRRWDGSGFRHYLLGGTLALCGHHHWLSACALGRAGQVRVTGLGVDRPRSPTGFVAQAGLRLAASFPVGGRWFLAAHCDGLGLLTPSRVMLNESSVWEMPRLGVVAGIDLLARFP
jgi:hypothetical protein